MAEYIRKEDALAFPFANGKYDHENADEHFINGCETYKEWLAQLPTGKYVERKRGKWLDYDDTEQFTARCSICGNRVDTRFAMNFCSNCGAKMEIQSEFFLNAFLPS